jgi:hypothetical protein
MKLKQIQKTQGDILELEENHHHEIADGMTTQENLNFDVEAEKYELKEQFLKLQSHSMKYNLIFSGIQQTDMENENTETILKHFLHTELDISNVADINFPNVHRLKPRTDGKPRSVIAKFASYSDHETVRKAAPKLKDRPQYSVSQQYPVEISDRRKQLYPKMRELQRQGRRANIVYDILIVDGRPYDPPPRRGPQDARAGR